MWARNFEIAIACWLAMSPFIFDYSDAGLALWLNDLGCALIVCILSTLSYLPRLVRMHVLIIPVGAWLAGLGYFAQSRPPDPLYQNHILVGLLLMMFALIPSMTHLPPQVWREYLGERSERESE